jgi:hypothetical protein
MDFNMEWKLKNLSHFAYYEIRESQSVQNEREKYIYKSINYWLRKPNVISSQNEDDSGKISNMADASIGRDTPTSKNLSHRTSFHLILPDMLSQ